MKTVGTELMPLAPGAMAAFQRDELKRFQGIANMVGIKAE
jgi:hypothetical protein